MINTKNLHLLDYSLIKPVGLLALAGLVMLYSASGGSIYPWFFRQAIYIAIFGIVAVAIAISDTKLLYHLSYPFYVIALVMLVLVEIKGHNAMGATRWLNLGFIKIQPSEIMKLALVFALARYFHDRTTQEILRIEYLIIPILLTIVPTGLILRQPDLGTAMILTGVAAIVFFVAGVRWWKFAIVFAIAIATIPLIWKFGLHDYQKQRIETFMSPELDPLGAGYHIIQSKIAIGSGGIFGKGYLRGSQAQLNFIPERQTDFIFATIGEEFGMIGCFAIIALYSTLIYRASRIAIRVEHQFGRLLCYGAINIIFLHCFINIAMVMGLVPVVGVPLPMISYGGTIVATMLISIGILLNIALNMDERDWK